jgi:hypothetical protein
MLSGMYVILGNRTIRDSTLKYILRMAEDFNDIAKAIYL